VGGSIYPRFSPVSLMGWKVSPFSYWMKGERTWRCLLVSIDIYACMYPFQVDNYCYAAHAGWQTKLLAQ